MGYNHNETHKVVKRITWSRVSAEDKIKLYNGLLHDAQNAGATEMECLDIIDARILTEQIRERRREREAVCSIGSYTNIFSWLFGR